MNKVKSKTKQKIQPEQLTCIELSKNNIDFVALLDGGSNCSIIGIPLIEKLGLTDQIVKVERPVLSFTGQVSKFIGHIYMSFYIGNKSFRNKFHIKPEMGTNSDVLLGTDFLSSSNVTIEYGQNGREITIQGKTIPLTEQCKRICSVNNTVTTTYAPADKPPTVIEKAKSCDYRRIDPWTGVVIRAALPGRNYPEHITAERSNDRGLIVEAQLLTTRQNEPSARAKCKNTCTSDKCDFSCPTQDYYYAYILIHNTSKELVYLKPGQTVAEIERQYENVELKQMLTNSLSKFIKPKRKRKKKANKNKKICKI